MTDVQIAPSPKAPIARRGRRRDRTQALKIQAVLTQAILDPKTPASAKASCAAAWSRVQESRRIIDNKPLPGQLRPELAQLRDARRLRSKRAVLSIAQSDLPASQPHRSSEP